MQRIFLFFIFVSLCLSAQPLDNQDILIMVAPSALETLPREFATRDASFTIEPLFGENFRNATTPQNWFIARPTSRTRQNTWDLAHGLLANHPEIIYAEPDVAQIAWPENTTANRDSRDCTEDAYSSDWDYPAKRVFQWHLDDAWTQLKMSRQADNTNKIRIAHFDTGYDPNHITTPKYLCTHLQKNFVDGENPNSAIDPCISGILNQPGHGTATIALLAGNRVQRPQDNFDDYMGAAPYMEVVPVRISSTVILFQSSSFAKALYYIMSPEVNCDVLSMSMGGVASEFWAKAVNDAYNKGIVLVTAAGNNVGKLPTTEVVYPACFNRVIAVCGATCKDTPYFKYGYFSLKMQGNYGPPEVMGSAIASYSPNTPWAKCGCPNTIDYDGDGTSAATPQVAGAAALWLQKYHDYKYDYPWQKVNAVRRALFSSADKSYSESTKYYGNGILRAKRALDIAPFKDSKPIPEDGASFALLRVIFGIRNNTEPDAHQKMLEVEMLRLRHNSPSLQEIFQTIQATQIITNEQRQKVKEIVLSIPECSQALAEALETYIR